MTEAKLFSWVEKLVNKGPFPNAQSSIFIRGLNMAIIGYFFPIIGYIYSRMNGIEILNKTLIPQQYSVEIILFLTGTALFLYLHFSYSASQRVKSYFTDIRDAIDIPDSDYQIFTQKTLEKFFNPPFILLILLVATPVVGCFEILSNPIYTGDIIVIIIFQLALILTGFINWNSFWILYIFLRTSKNFGSKLPLRINPFAPDRIGGLSSLSTLSTYAIFSVGLLSAIIIPLWYIFSSSYYLIWVILSSILIPTYFFYSMGGVYKALLREKKKSLKELNDELYRIASDICDFIKIDHKKECDKGELEKLGQTLNSINIIYERINSMHIFPVNSEVIIKIILSTILPLIGILVDLLSGYIISVI